jgi:hypothetical protein
MGMLQERFVAATEDAAATQIVLLRCTLVKATAVPATSTPMLL